jgi:HEAT repeats
MFRGPRNAVTLFLLLTIGVVSARAQPTTGPVDLPTDPGPRRPIGIIDFYGMHQLTAEQLRNELTFKVGDSISIDDLSFFEASKQRLMMVPGVARAHVNVVCCTDGRPVVFVGIEEKNAPAMLFSPAPTGSIRLPPEVLRIGAEFDQLVRKAVLSGHAEEDDSEGHMLLIDAAARPTEDRLIAIAHNDLRLLRRVLRDSADSEHRALAAQLLGYAKDLQSAVPDLVYAMSDSSDGVRNNAMRALSVFTRATKVKPPRVPYEPFIALLNSPAWTDRNKSSFALMQMASRRDPALLRMLREQALPSLVEMARWSDRGHAAAAFWILGNVAGLDDKDIAEDWDRNDRERVIEVALGR